ncbi:hypothetical protein OBV_30830 [Oscillibacter valericigenes Sjm18-20]|nr:hypothetical protein OBV_30830 [Oscillibacter valericigenes Sjm18-20]
MKNYLSVWAHNILDSAFSPRSDEGQLWTFEEIAKVSIQNLRGCNQRIRRRMNGAPR